MCLKTVLLFCILLKETFSNSITFRVINKYGKRAVAKIATFRVRNFGKASARRVIFF